MIAASSRKSFAITWLLIGPALIYALLIIKYAVNFPFLDDYDTILSHLLLPAREELANWFSIHNVHIHWVLKATASLDAWLFEEVNLVRLMWVGVAFFISFYLALLSACRRWDIPTAWLIALPFLLFQPSYWGSMTWATTSLHNFPGILCTFLALLLWTKPKPLHKTLAIICLVSALFIHGFGVAALVAVLFWETYSVVRKKIDPETQSSKSLINLITLGTVLAGWILFRIALEDTVPINTLKNFDLGTGVLFFSNFLGSCIHFLGSPWIAILAIAQLGVFVHLSTKGFARKNPELYFFIIYLLLSAMITTLARAYMGPNQGLASRYRIYSTLLVCVQYLGLAQLYWKRWGKRRWLQPTAVGVAILFYATSLYVNVNNLDKIRDRLMADRDRWTKGELIQEFPHPEHAARVLSESEQAGTFLPKDGSAKE
jgi:hypothetical protein